MRVLRTGRKIALILIDAVLVNIALVLSLLLRFDGAVPGQYFASLFGLALPFTAVWLASFYIFKLYNRMWQYASTGELLAIMAAVTAGSVVNISLVYFLMEGSRFPLPRSVFILSWMLIVILIGGSRLNWRLLRERRFKPYGIKPGQRVLIVGAGDAGAAVVRELFNFKEGNGQRLLPVGFVDDDPSKQKMQLLGLKVLGNRQDIPRLVRKLGVDEVIIAMPSVPGRVVREIVNICQMTGARLKTLPGMYELLNGRATVNQIREVQVEDILGREPVKVDLEAMAGYLAGRTVLVTGAGGSIGSELCRQAARFNPRLLVLLGHGENSIYDINQELGGSFPALQIATAIVDVRDQAAVERVFQTYWPQVIFHAAAHKHVPLMEENAAEAVKNNVLGTLHVARAAERHRAEVFILVSTDKAVNPVSVMGACKRLAEMVVQEKARNATGTRFAAVRFGNVLGSRGSVVPLFKKQIAAGGPLTVTHPGMTRYFMTIPEAVQLIIQAGSLAKGGEIFVLDMGDPVKILDLAESMIRLSGLEPGRDIQIVFSGVRPGEKIQEELLTRAEDTTATRHRRIFIARPDMVDNAALESFLNTISRSTWDAEHEEVVEFIRTILTGFRQIWEGMVI